MQRSFIKNIKERKEHNILFMNNAKELENARSFEKNGCPTLQWVYPIGTCSAFFYIYLPDLICTVYLYVLYLFSSSYLGALKIFRLFVGNFCCSKKWTGNFPSICRKLSLLKNMNWKRNTNRRYILNPANRRKRKRL